MQILPAFHSRLHWLVVGVWADLRGVLCKADVLLMAHDRYNFIVREYGTYVNLAQRCWAVTSSFSWQHTSGLLLYFQATPSAVPCLHLAFHHEWLPLYVWNNNLHSKRQQHLSAAEQRIQLHVALGWLDDNEALGTKAAVLIAGFSQTADCCKVGLESGVGLALFAQALQGTLRACCLYQILAG